MSLRSPLTGSLKASRASLWVTWRLMLDKSLHHIMKNIRGAPAPDTQEYQQIQKPQYELGSQRTMSSLWILLTIKISHDPNWIFEPGFQDVCFEHHLYFPKYMKWHIVSLYQLHSIQYVLNTGHVTWHCQMTIRGYGYWLLLRAKSTVKGLFYS